MLNYFFGNKTLINEKTLERNNITIISLKDIRINKNQIIALTATGKFYGATYKNEAVSVKVVDISKDESIINEFIYWQEFKSKECFLKFYGACIYGTEAYLVFEFFAFTLENALKNKILKNDNLPKIAKQILNILVIIQRQKKMIKDLRPGILGISDGFKVKLLDFGRINKSLN
jgi:serine/threonine protein kinase